MAFLSISVDMAESTRIKQEMAVVARGDRAYLEALYERFAGVLFNIERELYKAFGACRWAHLDGLYLVKSVGDEYWYAYELPEDEALAADLATEVVGVLMRLSAAERFLSLVPAGRNGGKASAGGEMLVFDIPLKIFIDVIDHAKEVNSLRYEHLKDILLTASGKGGGATYRVDEGFVEVCRRLNMGGAEAVEGRSGGVTVRPDFIGLEVDRFFRLAKCCHAAMVGVGEQLMALLPHGDAALSADLDHIPIRRLDLRAGDGLSCFLLTEEVREGRLKGLAGAYSIHHLFDGATLGEAVYASPRYIEPLLAPTRGFLAENGFYAIDRSLILP